jgi:hypothetical protein
VTVTGPRQVTVKFVSYEPSARVELNEISYVQEASIAKARGQPRQPGCVADRYTAVQVPVGDAVEHHPGAKPPALGRGPDEPAFVRHLPASVLRPPPTPRYRLFVRPHGDRRERVRQARDAPSGADPAFRARRRGAIAAALKQFLSGFPSYGLDPATAKAELKQSSYSEGPAVMIPTERMWTGSHLRSSTSPRT